MNPIGMLFFIIFLMCATFLLIYGLLIFIGCGLPFWIKVAIVAIVSLAITCCSM